MVVAAKDLQRRWACGRHTTTRGNDYRELNFDILGLFGEITWAGLYVGQMSLGMLGYYQ